MSKLTIFWYVYGIVTLFFFGILTWFKYDCLEDLKGKKLTPILDKWYLRLVLAFLWPFIVLMVLMG